MYGLSVLTTQAGPLLCTLILVSMPFGVSFFTKSVYFFRMSSGVLIGHQAHRDLGRSLGRDDRLRSGGGEASGHAVNFQRGTRPGAIQHRVSGLAGENLGADFGLAIVLFVEGQTLPGFQFVLRRSFDVFVEAGNQDLALRVFQLADDFDQREERIRRGAAVHAGVQIGLRALASISV